MTEENFCVEKMSREQQVALALDLMHRTIVHHVFWFKEVEHQLGFEGALEIMDTVYEKSRGVYLNRLSKFFGFELVEGIPRPFLEMPAEKRMELLEALSLNWLAIDGVWFQEVEFKHGMLDSKRCGDSCWVWFSPFEAWSVRKLLELPERPGLEGLKKALQLRLYARINVQSIMEESPESIVLYMHDCRVQSARKRKGLDDYPCKSAGLVEYANFAKAIDPRIKTQCLGCPPDAHPGEWYCAWRFSIENS
ncbi:MAG: DUF6125 family protein [Clostridia bacterium]|nr:DUF6125 family protein [Clostridia bacterium]